MQTPIDVVEFRVYNVKNVGGTNEVRVHDWPVPRASYEVRDPMAVGRLCSLQNSDQVKFTCHTPRTQVTTSKRNWYKSGYGKRKVSTTQISIVSDP